MRTVKTASGATAVQIVHSSRRGSRDIEHIGSARDDVQVEVQGNRFAWRPGEDGFQVCRGGLGQPVDALHAERVHEAAVLADVPDRPRSPPRPVGHGRGGTAPA